ncbi:hypothetical protein COHA_008959 [Chlorella ohadii]|uniref:Uncharacterized protein n=1 Tax=Chlorella ohadii TaxID=2649997 RepID=A0AAD5DKF0_9CHLO|nr:hypothetical protein COHA_008959 [Chlorella ohadii]
MQDIVELHCACARASPWLWLTPYFGHRCAAVVDDFVTSGWSNGELAVRFTEAYAQLAGSGRYTQVAGKWVRLVRAALQHPLSSSQGVTANGAVPLGTGLVRQAAGKQRA